MQSTENDADNAALIASTELRLAQQGSLPLKHILELQHSGTSFSRDHTILPVSNAGPHTARAITDEVQNATSCVTLHSSQLVHPVQQCSSTTVTRHTSALVYVVKTQCNSSVQFLPRHQLCVHQIRPRFHTE